MRALAVIPLLAALGCGDAAGPNLQGPTFLKATIDGQTSRADTTVAFLFGLTADTGQLSVTGVFPMGADSTLEVTVALDEFPRTGSFVIGDVLAPGFGILTVYHHTGNVVDSLVHYASTAASPGVLRITGIDRADSVVTAEFSFTGVGDLEHPGPRMVRGSFRVRYSFQQILPPGRPGAVEHRPGAGGARNGE